MMNLRQRTVNVRRDELLCSLKQNRAAHKKEYAEALKEYRERLIVDLETASNWAKRTDIGDEVDVEKLLKFRFNVSVPQDHRVDYDDVIEMLEMSVDEIIELDAESFKAYIKNEWSWTRGFLATKTLYSAPGAFLG